MSRGRKGRRLAVSMALMTLALGAIVARLLFVQGINAGMYQADARSEYVHEILVPGRTRRHPGPQRR